MSNGDVHPIERLLASRSTRQRDLEVTVSLAESAPVEPPELRETGIRSARSTIHGHRVDVVNATSVEDARRIFVDSTLDYYKTVHPEYVHGVQIPAGVGKTWGIQQVSYILAREYDEKIFQMLPRHDMWPQVIEAAVALGIPTKDYFHWLSRQSKDGHGGVETCRHTGPINEYMKRGHDAVKFCLGVCGPAYMKGECPYHQQAPNAIDQGASVIVGQHKHLWLGHILSQQIGIWFMDESPLSAAFNVWDIPEEYVVPNALTYTIAAKRMAERLLEIVKSGQKIFGLTLLDALAKPFGGLLGLKKIVDHIPPPESDPNSNWNIRNPAAVLNADYRYIPMLAKNLRHEIDRAIEGVPCEPRVVVDSASSEKGTYGVVRIYGAMTIPYRPPGAPPGVEGWSEHGVVTDATLSMVDIDGLDEEGMGTRTLEALLQRPVKVLKINVKSHARIFQVHSRANGIAALMSDTTGKGRKKVKIEDVAGDEKSFSRQTRQLEAQVERIVEWYRENDWPIGIIGAKKLIGTELFAKFVTKHPGNGEPMIGWFGGERGTNFFQPCRTLILLGIPQPPPDDLLALARCVFSKRFEPFTNSGSLERKLIQRQFNYEDAGSKPRGKAIDAWIYADPDVNALLGQLREAELVQAANRARGVLASEDKPKHIWCLFNLPVTELPPDVLLSIADVMGAPNKDGRALVDQFMWPKVEEYARECAATKELLTSRDLVEKIGVARATAGRYVRQIIDQMFDDDGNAMFEEPSKDDVIAFTRLRGKGRAPLMAKPTNG